MSNFISSTAVLGDNVVIGHFSIIEDNVRIGNNVIIGNNVTIKKDTVIGDDSFVSDNTVLGRAPKPAKASTVKVDKRLPGLVLGSAAIVGSCVVLYRGIEIGKNIMIGDQVFVRENTIIGDDVVLGRGVSVENKVKIGSKTKIQTNAYITAYTEIEQEVFIAPCVVTTNDNFMGRTEERFQYIGGPKIKRGARVGGGAVLLPNVIIDNESFIAAGAVVNKDTTASKVYVGVPAKVLRNVPDVEKL